MLMKLNCYLAHADLAADLAVAVADLAHLAVAVAVADLAVAVAVADLAHLAVAVAVADLAHHSLDLAHLAVAADLGYLAFAVIGGFAHGLFQDLRKIKISFNKIPKITSLSHPFSLFKIKY